MEGTPFVFRLAQPHDVPRLVSLHFAVFDRSTHLATLLGRRLIHRCYDWYVSSGEGFVVVAVDVTGIVGLCAFNEGTYYRVFRANAATAIWALALRPLTILRAPVRRRMGALLDRTIAPAAQKQHPSGRHGCLALLAVHPSVRGRNVARGVVSEGIARCTARGWLTVDTAAHAGNSVIALYERVGFVRDRGRDSDDLMVLQLDLSPWQCRAEPAEELQQVALRRNSS